MYCEELLKILEEEIAPLSLSDEYCAKYGAYDNSGIIIDCGEPVTGAVFSLDLSENSINAALAAGANCIITHHPAIYGGLKRISDDPVSRNVARCIKLGVSVISMHLNFDCAEHGTDYYLMRALGGGEGEVMDKTSSGGYGRVYLVQPMRFSRFAANAASVLHTGRMVIYGDENKIINRVASFCGAGGDEKAAAFAAGRNADAFVSADMKHHVIADLVQRGMCVVNLTHYCSESYGFGMIANKIIRRLNIPASFFEDGEML